MVATFSRISSAPAARTQNTIERDANRLAAEAILERPAATDDAPILPADSAWFAATQQSLAYLAQLAQQLPQHEDAATK